MYLYTQMEIVTKCCELKNEILCDDRPNTESSTSPNISPFRLLRVKMCLIKCTQQDKFPLVCPSSVLKYENLATHNCLIIVELKKYWVFLVIWVRSFNVPNAKLYLPRINILWVLYIFLKPSTVHQLYLKGNTLNFVSKEQTWNMTQPHCINFFRKHFCWLSIKIFVGPRCYVFQ